MNASGLAAFLFTCLSVAGCYSTHARVDSVRSTDSGASIADVDEAQPSADAQTGAETDPDAGALSDARRDSTASSSTAHEVARCLGGTYLLLARAIERSGVLDDTQPFTLFAPNDDGFTRFGITRADIDSMSIKSLRALVQYHVLAYRLTAADVRPGPVMTAANLSANLGVRGAFTVNGGSNVAGGAVVTGEIASCASGVIHRINAALLPPRRCDARKILWRRGLLRRR